MKLKKSILGNGLRRKILLFFSLTCTILVAVLATVAIKMQLESNKKAEIRESISKMSVTQRNLEQVIAEIDIIGIRISNSENIKALMNPRFRYLEPDEENLLFVRARNQLYDQQFVLNSWSLQKIILLSGDGRVYSNVSGFFVEEDYETIFGEPFEPYEESACDGYEIDIGTVSGKSVASSTLVYTREFYVNGNGRKTAKVILLLPRSFIMQKLESSSLPGDNWAIIGKSGKILLSNQPYMVGRTTQNIFGVNVSSLRGSSGTLVGNVPRHFLTYQYNFKQDFCCLNALPKIRITEDIWEIVLIVIMLSVLALGTLISFSFYLSKRLTEPLLKLGWKMSEAEHGDMYVRFHSKFNDEIGFIGRQFDKMIAQLNQSMHDLQRTEEEKRKAELQVLELQINPHFLYNTLSTIIWMTNKGKSDEVIDITELLSNYFRLSLSKGKEIIPLRDELEHVKIYIRIQNYRYANEVKMLFDVPEEVKTYLAPKLVLQPLVENALYHGVKTRDDGGIIRVSVRRIDSELVYEVWDNGVEMTEEKCQELNMCLRQKKWLGIGTSTVNERLKLYYGTDYGITFFRRNGWTKVTAIIPIAKEDAETHEYFDCR